MYFIILKLKTVHLNQSIFSDSFTLSLAEATDDRREELLTQWIARSSKEKDDKPTSSASPESSTSNSASPPQLDDNDVSLKHSSHFLLSF